MSVEVWVVLHVWQVITFFNLKKFKENFPSVLKLLKPFFLHINSSTCSFLPFRLACETVVRVPSCWWTQRWYIQSPSRLTPPPWPWKPSRSPAHSTWASSPASNLSPQDRSRALQQLQLELHVTWHPLTQDRKQNANTQKSDLDLHSLNKYVVSKHQHAHT